MKKKIRNFQNIIFYFLLFLLQPYLLLSSHHEKAVAAAIPHAVKSDVALKRAPLEKAIKATLAPSESPYYTHKAEIAALQAYFDTRMAHRLSPDIQEQIRKIYSTPCIPCFSVAHVYIPKIVVKAGRLTVQGFHHDPQALIQKSGIISFDKISAYTDGCYKTTLSISPATSEALAILAATKSFFPSTWTRKEVLENIGIALKNAQKTEGGKPDEKIFIGTIPGTPPLKVLIRIRLTAAAPIITTIYPLH